MNTEGASKPPEKNHLQLALGREGGDRGVETSKKPTSSSCLNVRGVEVVVVVVVKLNPCRWVRFVLGGLNSPALVLQSPSLGARGSAKWLGPCWW